MQKGWSRHGAIDPALTVAGRSGGMRFTISLALAAMVTACSAPAPGFRDRPAVRMDVSGHVFDIRVSSRRAEAIRLSPRWAPRLSSVGVPAVVAIETVSAAAG